jgi:hypothetical protein
VPTEGYAPPILVCKTSAILFHQAGISIRCLQQNEGESPKPLRLVAARIALEDASAIVGLVNLNDLGIVAERTFHMECVGIEPTLT